ncbi:peptidoglycan-binding protein [Streptomyces sp. NPDC004031]
MSDVVRSDSATESEPAEQKVLTRRRWVLVAAVTGALGLSAGGLAASTLVKSPEQVAAEAAPPSPSAVTAPVERRVLSQTVVMRGVAAPSATTTVAAPAAEDGGKSVVTRAPVKQGQSVTPGTVVAEVSGRPVIVLPGRIPLYRDIRPGMSGPDVRQLQSALRGLGYAVRDTRGTYGTSTEAAVKALYRDRGYQPPTLTETVGAPAPDPGTADPGTAGSATDGSGTAGSSGTDGSGTAAPQTAPPGPSGSGGTRQRKRYWVKAGELAFVTSLPARVATISAGLGADVGSHPVLTLSVGDVVVRGTLATDDGALVHAGMKVTVLAEQTGVQAAGKVTSIGPYTQESTGGSGGTASGDDPGDGSGDAASGGTGQEQSPAGRPVVVAGVKPLPGSLVGQDVRLTIETASTGGKVLAVPAAAVYATADGSAQVVVLRPDGRRQRVPVTVGATGAGYVEIRGGAVAEGDDVVVGT